MTTMPDIPTYPSGKPIRMEQGGPWPAAVHRFNAKTVAALRAAEATNRPLLIRGLPGVGKSMSARAAAVYAKRPLLAHVIDSRTEADDLKARFDTVRRLADAQIRRDANSTLPDEVHYLTPQVLWWAFDWVGAQKQQRLAQRKPSATQAPEAESGASTAPVESPGTKDGAAVEADTPPVDIPPGWQPNTKRSVLLLDEIDKADVELPNALLEAFGANSFTVPVTGLKVSCLPERRPLIVITTNEERELPGAFLRRCLVLWLTLPDKERELVDELVAIGTEHQQWLMQERQGGPLRKGACLVIKEAAQLVAVRRLELRDGAYQPGTSEFLDLVAALAELWPGNRRAQKKQLGNLQDFVLNKSGEPNA